MNPRELCRELFGMVVRTSGFFLIAYGLVCLPGVVWPQSGTTMEDYLVGAVAMLVVGVLLLFSADRLVDAAYRDRKELPPTI